MITITYEELAAISDKIMPDWKGDEDLSGTEVIQLCLEKMNSTVKKYLKENGFKFSHKDQTIEITSKGIKAFYKYIEEGMDAFVELSDPNIKKLQRATKIAEKWKFVGKSGFLDNVVLPSSILHALAEYLNAEEKAA